MSIDQPRPTPNSSEMVVTHFDDTKRGSSAAENRQKDASRVKSALKGLFQKFTGTHQEDKKVGNEVMLVTAGMVPAEASKPKIPEAPTFFEPIKANNTEKEDMAAAIAAGPTSPTEDRERIIAQEQEAKARARLEEEQRAEAERVRNQRVAGDPSGYDAYQAKRAALQEDASDWIGSEAAATKNIISGALDVTADEDIKRTEALKEGENALKQAEQDRLDRIAMGKGWENRDKPEASAPVQDWNPSVIRAEEVVESTLGDQAADQILRHADEQRAEERDQVERTALGNSWIDAHRDNASSERIEESDNNPSVLKAESEVDQALGDAAAERILRHAEEQRAAEKDRGGREALGESWKKTHSDNEIPTRLEESDGNPSILKAEGDVETALGDQAADRILRHANEQRDREAAQADREASGRSWIDAHSDNVGTRLEDSDRNPSVVAAEREVTGPYGENERRGIVEEMSQGADDIADRFDQPIAPGEIIVRRPERPTLADTDTDPEVTEQRGRLGRMIQRVSPRWRRGLAVAGMLALALIPHDRGPASSPVEAGSLPIVEAPYVPMPELPKEPVAPSPLDALPKTMATFPTEGPAGENISTKQADFGGWFDAKLVETYKANHPDQFTDHKFDMRNMYDINLLNKLKSDERFQQARDMFMGYITTHEIRGGDPRKTIDVQKNPDGSIAKVLIDVPNIGGYEVPDIAELYKLVTKPKQ